MTFALLLWSPTVLRQSTKFNCILSHPQSVILHIFGIATRQCWLPETTFLEELISRITMVHTPVHYTNSLQLWTITEELTLKTLYIGMLMDTIITIHGTA